MVAGDGRIIQTKGQLCGSTHHWNIAHEIFQAIRSHGEVFLVGFHTCVGLYSQSGKTPYYQTPWNHAGARYGFEVVRPRYLKYNRRLGSYAVSQVSELYDNSNTQLWDQSRSGGKTSYRLVNGVPRWSNQPQAASIKLHNMDPWI